MTVSMYGQTYSIHGYASAATENATVHKIFMFKRNKKFLLNIKTRFKHWRFRKHPYPGIMSVQTLETCIMAQFTK